ncbi:hypothetical protein SCANM124S_02591 [Streptomyces canus]
MWCGGWWAGISPGRREECACGGLFRFGGGGRCAQFPAPLNACGAAAAPVGAGVARLGSVGGSGPGWGVSVLGPAVAVSSAVLDNGRRPLRADTPPRPLRAVRGQRPVVARGAANGPSWRAGWRSVRRGARGAGTGPSWCAGWRSVRRGAGCGDRSIVARGVEIGPLWWARWRAVRCGAGDCNSPGARGTARPATTDPQPPVNPTRHPGRRPAQAQRSCPQPPVNPTRHPRRRPAQAQRSCPQPPVNPTRHPHRRPAQAQRSCPHPPDNPTRHPRRRPAQAQRSCPQPPVNPTRHPHRRPRSHQAVAAGGVNCRDSHVGTPPSNRYNRLASSRSRDASGSTSASAREARAGAVPTR